MTAQTKLNQTAIIAQAFNGYRDTMQGMLRRVQAHHNRMNGTAPHYDDAQVPTGDDYDKVFTEVQSSMVAAASFTLPEFGRLWWIADDAAEFVADAQRMTDAGAEIISVDATRDAPRIHWVFRLPKARAAEILGYVPDAHEWLQD